MSYTIIHLSLIAFLVSILESIAEGAVSRTQGDSRRPWAVPFKKCRCPPFHSEVHFYQEFQSRALGSKCENLLFHALNSAVNFDHYFISNVLVRLLFNNNLII